MAALTDAGSGATVSLDAVADLLAIQGSPRPDWGELRPLESVVELDAERRALSESGWSLVRPSPATAALYQQGRAPADALDVGRVYRCGRQVLVATRHVVLRLDDGMDDGAVVAFLAARGLELEDRLRSAPNVIRVRLAREDPFEAAERVAAADGVLWAEPDPLFTPQERFTPTDPRYREQWHHRQLGSEDAWAKTRGAGVRIGIIDRSFDIKHADLSAGVRQESTQRRADGAWLLPSSWAFPGEKHGTWCAGVAGARANNGTGGCGVAPEADLLLVAIGIGPIPLSAFSRAFEKAYEARADVVSSSVSEGEIPLTQALKLAIKRLDIDGRNGYGTPVFWAAPNDNIPVYRDRVASYAPVIAVGASDDTDAPRAAAYGPALDFLAPGTSILTTSAVGEEYLSVGGTSIAAPCAAGVAALVIAVHPTLKGHAVRRILRTTCDKIGQARYGPRSERNDTCGWGRIHAGGAVLRAAYLSARNAPG